MEPQSEPSRVSFGVPLRVALATDVGQVRLNNEDAARFAWGSDGSLHLVVADGMGGHDAGEIASKLAVDALVEALDQAPEGDPRERLHAAMLHTNQVIIDQAKVRNTRGMGTTAVASVVRGAEVFVGWVGDSRVYWIRRGRAVWRSFDHTRVQALVDIGQVTPDEAREHPEAGMLTRALGHAKMIDGRSLAPEVLSAPFRLEAGDAVVWSTDGLHDLLDDDEIAAIVADRTPDESAQELVRVALERGGHDNVTVAVLVAGSERAAAVDPAYAPEAPGLVAGFSPPEPRDPADALPPEAEVETEVLPSMAAAAADPEGIPTVEHRRIPIVTLYEVPTDESPGPFGVESSPRSRAEEGPTEETSDPDRRVSPSWDPRWGHPAAGDEPPTDRSASDRASEGRAWRRQIGGLLILLAVLGFAVGALALALFFGGVAWWASN